MWTRSLLTVLMILGGWAFYSPPVHAAACEVHTNTDNFPNLTVLGFNLCDATGALKTSGGGVGGESLGATANAAAPTHIEAAAASLWVDLGGLLHTAIDQFNILLAGEDLDNQLMRTSGGAVRTTQILGSGGIPSTASDTASLTSILPVGMKTFQGVVTCISGTCIQTQKIYGSYKNTASTAQSELVCTLTLNGGGSSAAGHDWCATDRNFSYWWVQPSLTAGGTPLSGVFVQY